MDDLIKSVEEKFIKDDLPELKSGDVIRVHERVEEGSNSRIQIFEGTLLKESGSGTSRMITVRKVSAGVGVEKTFPLHSPRVEKVELVKEGGVRQSRPYYLRERIN